MYIVPKDDPCLNKHYAKLVALFPNATFICDDNGVYRFQTKPLMRWICDRMSEDFEYMWMRNRVECPCSLNSMAKAYHRKEFSLEEYMQFYMNIGYSLSGFYEVFGDEIDILMKDKV